MEYAKLATEYLAPIAFFIFTPLAAVFVRAGIRWVERRLDLLSVETERELIAALTEVVDGGVAYAEAQALRWAQDRDELPDGAQKLEDALGWITLEAHDRGLPEIARDRLVRLVESRLGTDGAPGALNRGHLKAHEIMARGDS